MNLNKSKIFNEYFLNKERCFTKEQLKERCQTILDILDADREGNNQNVALLSDYDPEALEMCSLELYLQICGAMEDKLLKQNYPILQHPLEETFPCDVYYDRELEAILIDTPVQIGSYRTYGNTTQQHFIADIVELSIKAYEQKNDISLYDKIKTPFCIYLIRRCKQGASSNSIPDIDNIGARHVVNILMRELGLSDSYSSFSWNCNTVEYMKDDTEQGGTSILVISEEKKLNFESKFLQNSHSMEWMRVN